MPTSFLIGGVAIEKTISINIFILGSLWYLIVFLISPVIADMVDAEEDLAFDIRTIGNTLKWNQNLILFNLGILTLWGSSLVAYMIMEVSYFVPVVSSVACLPLVLYSIRLRNEDGVIASQKLRSISYIFITLNPLLLALGVVL